jgi:outer membrane lipoprotein carrier protein
MLSHSLAAALATVLADLVAPAPEKVSARPDAGVKVAPAAEVKPAPEGGLKVPHDAETIGAHDAGAVASADAGVVAPAPMTAEVKALVERMQSFYEKTQDFSADFKQDYTYKAFKRTVTSTGKVTFRKPALMRWEYEKPSARTFVLAGDRVYAYDPEAKLLTRASIGTNKLSASVTFLWGQGRLADEFAINQGACAKCTGTLLELNPLKPDPRFKRVLLEVDPKTAQVLKSTVIDPDGSENAISFLKLVTNTGVEEKAFKLTPPPGTEVKDLMGGPPPAPAAAARPDAGAPAK